MNSWGFLRSRKWILSFVLVCIFAVLCHLLAQWQLARRAEAQAEIRRVAQNYDAPPVPLTEALPTLTSYDVDDKWKPVQLVGRYLSAQEILVRNRPCSGASGYDVLTPLLLDAGQVFFVDRGCVPAGSEANTPAVYAPAPAGSVSIVARLRASEPEVTGRSDTGNTTGSIDLRALASRVSQPAYIGAYGMLDTNLTADAPYRAERPVPDEGPHLSYALQWYVFAVIAFGAYGWAARAERQQRLSDLGAVANEAESRTGLAEAPVESRAKLSERYGESGAGGRMRARRAKRVTSDAEREDALLDQTLEDAH
ncbi:MAG: SURF1 family protein [Agromyces sp.]